MTRNNVFVGDRRVLRRYIGDRLIFDDLSDKTEILSGTEIFTDDADDATVHVGVEGKSYQNAGSGKNVFNDYILSDRSNFQLGQYSGSPVFQLKSNTTYVISAKKINPSPGGYHLVLNVMNATDGAPLWGSSGYSSKIINAIFNMQGTHIGFPNFSRTFTTPESGMISFSYYDGNLTGLSPEGNWFTDVMIEPQMEEGSTATAYELPAPSPDYPIEIHSLNDFDMVSSVGRRNYLLNSDRDLSSSGPIISVPIDDAARLYPLIGETVTISVDIRADEPMENVDFYLRNNSSATIVSGTNSPKFNVSESFERYSHSFELVDITELTSISFTIRGFLGVSKYIRNVKLEKGNTVTDWTPAPEDITESYNHPLIDKINLLLDEPLRSVGNVKDRLFRDTDGLWKVERNLSERLFNGSENWSTEGLFRPSQNYAYTSIVNMVYSTKNIITTSLILAPLSSQVTEGWNTSSVLIINLKNDRTGVLPGDSRAEMNTKFKNWVQDNPFTIVYEISNPSIETLPQPLQDKLNNLRSFKDSNYIYTILPDESDIIQENLKPTLHATFKSIGWETFRKKLTKEE